MMRHIYVIFPVLILLALVICCCHVFYRQIISPVHVAPHEYTVTGSVTEPFELKIFKSFGKKMIADDYTRKQLLEIRYEIDSLKAENKRLQMQNEYLVADIRQETNNIINKMNGWLGFWIATSTLLCIIVPIMSQIHNRHEVNKMIDQVTNDIVRVQSNLTIQSRLSQFQIGIENKLIHPLSEDSGISEAIWHKAIDRFDLILQPYLSKKTLDSDDIFEIQCLLIQVYGFVIDLKCRSTIRHSRPLNVLDDAIKTLFDSLGKRSYGTPQDLENSLQKLISQMKGIFAQCKNI